MTMRMMMVTMVMTSAQVAAAARELEVELARLSTCHVRVERCCDVVVMLGGLRG